MAYRRRKSYGRRRSSYGRRRSSYGRRRVRRSNPRQSIGFRM